MKESRNGIIAVFGISETEMSVKSSKILQPYIGDQRKFNTLRNMYTHSVVRPRKVTSFLDNLSAEKIFYDRNNYSDSYRQKKGNELCVEWGNSLKEYCQKTSLHGLKYVGDSELNLSERLIWMITFIFGVLGAAYFITNLYNRWNDNPMIITLSPKATLLETIPFPAVTICNMNGAKKSVAELVDLDSNDSQSLFEKHMLRKLCGDRMTQPRQKINASWSKMQNFMIKVSQPCHSMLVTCSWKSELMQCQDLFNPEITDEGMCCSFNKVKRNFIYRNPRQQHGMNYTFPYPGIDWTPERGYPPDAPPNANPWRVFGPGKGHGLSIVLDAELFDYYCSSTASVGFKVLLHSPVETPRISEFAYFITPGEEMRVEITPKISSTTPELVNIPESKRRCVFTSERNLRFYRTYTQRNCELECQSNYTLAQCKCVPFYLPKDTSTRVCGTADDECVEAVKDIAEKRFSNVGGSGSEWDKPKEINCSCLPSCVQIFYSKQTSTGKLDDVFKVHSSFLNGKEPAYYKRFSIIIEIPEYLIVQYQRHSLMMSAAVMLAERMGGQLQVNASSRTEKVKNMAVVHFFFVESSFTSFEKGEIFGFTDFLSNTGGLLGLFLGFSFISAAEIAYFMTMKVFCSIRRNKRRESESSAKALPFAK